MLKWYNNKKMGKKFFLEDLQDHSGRLPWKGHFDLDQVELGDFDQDQIRIQEELDRVLIEVGEEHVIYSRDGRLFRWATYDDPLLWHRCSCPTARKDQRGCLYELFENVADPEDVFCTHCGFLPKGRVRREKEEARKLWLHLDEVLRG